MYDVIIQDIVDKKIEVLYNNDKISLPLNIQEQIENYWLKILKDGKVLRRGDVFGISVAETRNSKINIEVKLTDYAHYIATLNNIIDKKYWCKVIYTAALVETLDKKIIIGEMGPDTSTPGRLQFPGGGIDKDDLEKNNINLKKNISKEIKEELGIDINYKEYTSYFKPHFLKTGGTHDFYAVIFKVELNLDQNKFIKLYNNYTETLKLKNITPEFNSLLFINNDPEEIVKFLGNNNQSKVDYLLSLLHILKMDNKYRNFKNYI